MVNCPLLSSRCKKKRPVPGGGLGVRFKRQSKCEGKPEIQQVQKEQRQRKGKSIQNKKKGTPAKKGGEVLSGSPSPGKGSEGISSFSHSPERQPPYSPLRRPQQNWKPQWIQQGWGRGKGAKPSGSGRGGNVNAQRNPQQWSGPGWGSWR